MAREDGLEQLGQFVRERRRELGLTQTELGDRLGWAQERVSVFENGKYGLPSLPQLVRLADALSIPAVALLGYLGFQEVPRKHDGRPADPAQVTGLLNRIASLGERVHGMEERLHDAERRLHDAETVCVSVRARREEMATLLAECRE